MAEIDKMYNLVNSIMDGHSAVIFLGAGASMEGRQGEKPYPSFEKLLDTILKDFGFDPTERKKRKENFAEIKQKWKDQKILAARLSRYLDGEPGLAHYYLAALSISLLSEYKVLLYLTTNYDDLMRKAFTALESNPLRHFTTRLISLPKKVIGSRFQEIVNNIETHIREGSPVLVKLFGDLDSESPIFPEDDMAEVFEKPVIEQMEAWLKNPTIFIGYSFKDKIMQSFLSSRSRGNSIFIVDPSKDLAKLERDHEGVYHIKKTFADFIYEMIEVIEKRGISAKQKIAEIFKSSAPRVKFPHFDSLQFRIFECSQVSLMRAEDKLPKIEIDGMSKEFVPIDRKDTGPDFIRFVKSEKPLLAVIGDSGSGKSTLLYKVARNQSQEDFITLFYDVHHLQEPGSLKKRLALDFNCAIEHLESVFEYIDKLLSRGKKRLLIIVDGLNESVTIGPSVLKLEIDDLGGKMPTSIKIAYSCRTIYWDTYIKFDTRINSKLYHDSKEFLLHKYSLEESKNAFKLYQSLYKFEGTFDLLKKEFKEKMRDPLMVRMLAEGYQGSKLPSFAPAVKVFKTYEETLRKKFEGTVLIEFIETLISAKLSEIENKTNVSDQFEKETFITNEVLSTLTLQQIGINKKKPVMLLEDEGILSSLDNEKSIYRFTYDRFFEYLLGKEIGKQIKVSSKEAFIHIIGEKVQIFQRTHFSFLQALKSEIIRRNIDDPDGKWTFYDPKTLKLLLYNEDAAIKSFAKEVLRELTFEAEKNTLDALRKITNNALEWKLLALDIASDSPKIKPILIEGLFSGEKIFMRRCTNILLKINEEKSYRRNFEDSISIKSKNSKYFKKEFAMGLIYYSAIIIALENIIGNNSFEVLKKFWIKILKVINEDLEIVKKRITSEFTKVLKIEGAFFNSTYPTQDGIEYLWKGMEKKERELALKMSDLIIEPELTIDNYFKDIIRFFGSEIKHWHDRNNIDNTECHTYIIEKKIAEWILIQHSQVKYHEVKEILDDFVKSDFWMSIDFALCTMENILKIIHNNNSAIINDGFFTMKKWVERFEKQKDKFYYTLRVADPFSINYGPLTQTSNIDALFFTSNNGPIKFLEERLTSSDSNRSHLALLCTRYLWKEYPSKVLGTLELVINSEDLIIREWIERILKEIYFEYPRLVEDFFWKIKMKQARILSIKYRTDIIDSIGLEHDGTPLYKELFLKSKKRRITFVQWYKKLLSSPNLENYCQDLIDFLFNEILSDL